MKEMFATEKTVNTSKSMPPGGMTDFTFNIESKLAPVFTGFDSVADKLSYDKPVQKISRDVEAELMANNPIFARISRGLDRVKKGQAAYTAEELIEARNDRFGADAADEFRFHISQSNENYDPEDPDEDNRWDKLMCDKYASGL